MDQPRRSDGHGSRVGYRHAEMQASTLASDESGWLMVLNEREAIQWVRDARRLAFTEGLCARARRIAVGELIILYAGRTAYHQPLRDRYQLIGAARCLRRVKRLGKPLTLAGREFACGCPIDIMRWFPPRQGVDFLPLVPRLGFIVRKDAWGHYMRRSLIRLFRLSAKNLRTMMSALGTASYRAEF